MIASLDHALGGMPVAGDVALLGGGLPLAAGATWMLDILSS